MKKTLAALAFAFGLLPASGLAQSAIDGTWKADQSNSRVTFRTLDGKLSMSAPGGGSYTASLDGGQAPVKGDPGAEAVTVRMKDARTMEETSYRGGKAFLTMTMTVDSSGRKAQVTWKNLINGKAGGYTMSRE